MYKHDNYLDIKMTLYLDITVLTRICNAGYNVIVTYL